MTFNPTHLAQRIEESFNEVLSDAGDPHALNEAETRTHLVDPTLRALGYRSFANFRQEYRLSASGQVVDYLLTVGDQRIVVEAKTASSKLNSKDSAQLVGYCAQEGVRWALLTNGVEWHVFDVDLPGDWQAKRVAQLNFLNEFRSGRGIIGLSAILANFALDSIADSGSEARLDAWARTARARTILQEQLSNPDSTLIASAVKELVIRGISLDRSVIREILVDALSGDGIQTDPPTSAKDKTEGKRVDSPKPNHYLFVASKKGGKAGQTGLDVLRELLDQNRWGVSTVRSPRTDISPGDQCCFYATGEGVVAKAEVSSDPATKPASDGYYPISLARVHWIDVAIPLGANVRVRLEAFDGKDPQRTWSWFVQTSIRKVSQRDFGVLTGSSSN